MSVQTTSTIDTNNVVDYYTNKEGDLFLKYFLIDSSFNTRGWAVDGSTIERLARTSIGAPFTDYEDFPETLFKDGHPWNPSPTATFRDHYDYAAKKATGYLVDFSPVSRNALKSASGLEIQNYNGMYVTVKVTDPKKRDLYQKNPRRIPRISPGILDHDNTPVDHGKTVLKNVDLVHLAGVKYGAYGEKARLYASCQGGYECVNHLKGASDTIKDPETYANTGNDGFFKQLYDLDTKKMASELSSLGENSTQNTDIMSDQPNPLSTVQEGNSNNEQLSTQTTNNINEQTQQPAQKLENAEITTKSQTNEETQTNNTENKQNNDNNSKQPFRLKTQKFDFQKQLAKEEEKKVPDWKQDPEYQKLLKEHEQLKAKADFEEEKRKYAELIPRELFILNGKFDTLGYNKELEKAVNKKLDLDYAKELYNLKLSTLKLQSKVGKPFGASASSNNNVETKYKTPDTVPTNNNNENLKGASGDIYSSQFAGLHNLRKMAGLIKEVNA